MEFKYFFEWNFKWKNMPISSEKLKFFIKFKDKFMNEIQYICLNHPKLFLDEHEISICS